jgi:hypothetical protein
MGPPWRWQPKKSNRSGDLRLYRLRKKSRGGWKCGPQRLKPEPSSTTYVRAEARTLLRTEFSAGLKAVPFTAKTPLPTQPWGNRADTRWRYPEDCSQSAACIFARSNRL